MNSHNRLIIFDLHISILFKKTLFLKRAFIEKYQQRKDMKGKNDFKKDEIKRIAELIRLCCMANREEQKQIRAEMRSLDFYGFDDFGYH